MGIMGKFSMQPKVKASILLRSLESNCHKQVQDSLLVSLGTNEGVDIQSM